MLGGGGHQFTTADRQLFAQAVVHFCAQVILG
jgi:hypothetical protein